MKTFDQRDQSVTIQYNINAATVMVVSDGLLNVLHPNKKGELLAFIHSCMRELPDGSPNQEVALRLLSELNSFAEGHWGELLNLSVPTSERCGRAKRDLGVLILGLSLGFGAKFVIDFHQKADSLKQPPAELNPKDLTGTTDNLLHHGATHPAIDPASPSFSYYLIGSASGHIWNGNLETAHETIQLARKLDPTNAFTPGLTSNITHLPSHARDAAAELDMAHEKIASSNHRHSSIPISKAAAEHFLAGLSPSLSLESFAANLKEHLLHLILPDVDAIHLIHGMEHHGDGDHSHGNHDASHHHSHHDGHVGAHDHVIHSFHITGQ